MSWWRRYIETKWAILSTAVFLALIVFYTILLVSNNAMNTTFLETLNLALCLIALFASLKAQNETVRKQISKRQDRPSFTNA